MQAVDKGPAYTIAAKAEASGRSPEHAPGYAVALSIPAVQQSLIFTCSFILLNTDMQAWGVRRLAQEWRCSVHDGS